MKTVISTHIHREANESVHALDSIWLSRGFSWLSRDLQCALLFLEAWISGLAAAETFSEISQDLINCRLKFPNWTEKVGGQLLLSMFNVQCLVKFGRWTWLPLENLHLLFVDSNENKQRRFLIDFNRHRASFRLFDEKNGLGNRCHPFCLCITHLAKTWHIPCHWSIGQPMRCSLIIFSLFSFVLRVLYPVLTSPHPTVPLFLRVFRIRICKHP